tara:strand:+ start:1145 stop:2605 length:1461 start_codon:yes stop_codon:yes gene_type:complete
MAKMINREAPLSGLSSLMAMKGRQGDTELIHMTKPEIAGLASLGKITINPDTGLPEAFSLKSLLPTLAALGITAATGGAGAPALFAGSSFVLPAVAAGATSAIVNDGDLGAIAFDGLLAGAGGALGSTLAGAGEATAGLDAVGGATAAGGTGALPTAIAPATTDLLTTTAAGLPPTTTLSGVPFVANNAITPAGIDALSTSAGKEAIIKGAGEGSITGKLLKGVGVENVTKPFDFAKGIPGLQSLTPLNTAAGAASTAATSGGTAALGLPSTGTGYKESLEFKAPEIAARDAAQSSYGTRAADAIRSQTAPQGLTTQDVLNSSLGRTDPLRYFNAGSPSSTSAPSSLYGQQSSVIANPAEGPGPVGAYVSQAAGGGSLQRIYEGMGGDIETFRGLVEGGGVGSDGMSDDISFEVIDDGEEGPDGALLSKDEYVVDAHTVAALGNGSTDAGADVLDNFVASIRNKVYNKGEQPKELNGLRELASLLS